MKARSVAAWVVALGLAFAAGLLIWRLAPVATADARVVLAAIPVLCWALAVLVIGPRTVPFEARAPNSDVPLLSNDGVTSARAIRLGLFDALRARRLAGRYQRYRVPLVVVLGPSGTGKSSLLELSGLDLDPPHASADATWWIGSEAIFVEATTGVVDPDRFAELLERFRPAQPVNAIVLAVCPADLTLADAVERREIGETITKTLLAIETRTRSRPPVYVVLTKTDLAPGFPEFFETLEPGERDHPWGFTMPSSMTGNVTAAETIQAFHAGIRSLVESTKARLVDALSRSTDPLGGGRLVHFGAQIAAMDPIVDAILKPILPNDVRKRRGAFLRGIYLTSARQDGYTIDALLPELAARYVVPRSGTLPPDLNLDDEENGFFVGGMLRRAVIGEAGLIGRIRASWYRRAVFGWLISTLCLIIAVGGAGLLYAAYIASETRVIATEITASNGNFNRLENLQTDLATLSDIAIAADRIERIEIADIEPGPFGLIVSPERLPRARSDAYERALRNSLLPHLIARLEGDLLDLDADTSVMADRIAAALPEAPDNAAARLRWVKGLAVGLNETAAANALLIQGPRAFALASGQAPRPAYVDAARRIIAARESLR